MRLSGRIDFAIRAAAELSRHRDYVALAAIAEAQDLPVDYVRAAMGDLRRAGIVTTRRGREGGYKLARPADQVTLADIIRAVDGPLTAVRGTRPEHLDYEGAAEPLALVWLAVRASERRILESVTLWHLASGELPQAVLAQSAD